MAISEKLIPYFSKSSSDVVLSAAIVEIFVFSIPAAFFLKLKDEKFTSYSLLKRVPLSSIPFILSSFLTFIFGSVIILYIQRALFRAPSAPALVNSDVEVYGVSIFLCYVLIPAVFEELFFRSFILSEYREFKAYASILTSALFFAMLHFSFSEFLFYFFAGALLGLITYVTGSAIPSLVIHLLNNTVTVYYGKALSAFLTESSSSVILAFLLVAAFLASLIWMLYSLEELYEKRSVMYENGTLPGKKRSLLDTQKKGKPSEKDIFLSPVFFLAVALFVLITTNVI